MSGSLEDNRTVRMSEYRQAVRRHAPSELLPKIAMIASKLREYEFDPSWKLFSPWGAAAIARDSLVYGTEYRSTPADERALRKIFRLFNQAEGGIPEGKELWLMMTAFLYEQGHYQDTPLHDIARTLVLLRDTPISAPEIPDRDWTEILGVDLEQWLIIVFALATATKGGGGRFDPASPERDAWQKLNPALSSHLVNVVVQQLVCTPREFRERTLSAPDVAEHLGRFAYNQLNSTPLIDFGDETVVAPQYLLILRCMLIENIFYRATRKWKVFPEELGYRVEAYTGRQLEYAEFTDIQPEITYGRENKKSVDWLVSHEDTVLLIECKAAKQNLDVRAGGLGALEYLESRVGKARDQIAKTLKLINGDQEEFTKYKGLDSIGLIVTAEPVHMANESTFIEGLPQTGCPTLVVSLRELEILCHLGADEMIRTLRTIVSDPAFNTLSAVHAIRQVADPDRMLTHNRIIEEAFDKTVGVWSPRLGKLSDDLALVDKD
ncbi:hypothetical protein NG702_06935 [Pseudarthrobacter sp. MDT3-28]|uniref:hypothetical protein n=1 Tax=Pseudarthrobacter raffinosi TaxID=2953651 RepID=UPI00208F0704|nr:hypothetical protein [Pseudarthrobacter sp. MDT3-28]MCO4237159.1 hypothetical protein [Pseudarthrobacter sp. MDT3-28]